MKQSEKLEFIAHFRKSDEKIQTVKEHLESVSDNARYFSGKIGLSSIGATMGILHDLGKYSSLFQSYIRSATGQINPDEDEYVDAKGMKGKIDHSSAGAQHVWKTLQPKTGPEWQLASQVMALCISSHHSGLIDCLSPVGEDKFSARMKKSKDFTHIDEVLRKLEESIQQKISECLGSDAIGKEFSKYLTSISNLTPRLGLFNLGMATRFLFSALIDADRLDSANFEDIYKKKLREIISYTDWDALIAKLESHILKFKQDNNIDKNRADISSHCLDFSSREKGLYLLTVPTGGGKTLASLRFAIHHAKQHEMERIIYVTPYTSIIDQNASVVLSIFEDEKTFGKIVLEHHSNLTPEKDTWQSKILSENWNAPIVYTTAVQFLETLFASGTRGARRMHQLANAIIIFDEIQTIPIKTIHIFNNAINFLVGQCGSTVIFCTATQPILDKVDKDKGAATLSSNPEIMPDVRSLFRELQRVEVIDERKNGGWQEDDIANRAIEELAKNGSVLVIVNTKAAAQGIYKQCKQKIGVGGPALVFHLSTSMCPAHRMNVIDAIKICLDPANLKPVICVSTQLIEAGVDIDFGCVIRYLAGIDSIAQAAGRCNRNGLRIKPGRVIVVNPSQENLERLPDIRIAKDKAERVMDEFKKSPSNFDHDLISPKSIELFYKYYFFDRADEMVYPISAEKIGRDGDMLSLLSTNELSIEAYKRMNAQKLPLSLLRQSFKSASEAFRAIDATTEGIIVPYGETGEQIIAGLCASFEIGKQYDLLRKAQRYSVNVFPNIMQRLKENKCIYEIQEGSGIMYLDNQYYSKEFGLSTEEVEPMKFRNI